MMYKPKIIGLTFELIDMSLSRSMTYIYKALINILTNLHLFEVRSLRGPKTGVEGFEHMPRGFASSTYKACEFFFHYHQYHPEYRLADGCFYYVNLFRK